MNNCDHTVGYMGDIGDADMKETLYQSTVEDEFVTLIENINSYNKTHNSHYGHLHKKRKTNYNLKDLLAGRITTICRFNFCPNCGERINWESILKIL